MRVSTLDFHRYGYGDIDHNQKFKLRQSCARAFMTIFYCVTRNPEESVDVRARRVMRHFFKLLSRLRVSPELKKYLRFVWVRIGRGFQMYACFKSFLNTHSISKVINENISNHFPQYLRNYALI